jgi:hypothetical protein
MIFLRYFPPLPLHKFRRTFLFASFRNYNRFCKASPCQFSSMSLLRIWDSFQIFINLRIFHYKSMWTWLFLVKVVIRSLIFWQIQKIFDPFIHNQKPLSYKINYLQNSLLYFRLESFQLEAIFFTEFYFSFLCSMTLFQLVLSL